MALHGNDGHFNLFAFGCRYRTRSLAKLGAIPVLVRWRAANLLKFRNLLGCQQDRLFVPPLDERQALAGHKAHEFRLPMQIPGLAAGLALIEGAVAKRPWVQEDR